MNEVSIIINRVRYDSVDATGGQWCGDCDLYELCNKHDPNATDLCYSVLNHYRVFKKSDKKFEP